MHRNVPMMQIFIYATWQFLLRICLQVLLTDLSREDKNPLAMYYCGLPTQHCAQLCISKPLIFWGGKSAERNMRQNPLDLVWISLLICYRNLSLQI